MGNLPQLKLHSAAYQTPSTVDVHQKIVRNAVEENSDVCLLIPTIREEYLDLYALSILFTSLGEIRPVFVVTPNTEVRDRYEDLRNGMHYSTQKWSLATVKSDGSLADRTEHARSDEAPPGVIFTRFSSRLPDDDICDRINAVLYDEAVKFEDDRWERFCEWRDSNGIGTVVYFIRDPTSDLCQRVSREVDITWAWTPDMLDSVLGSGVQQPRKEADGGTIVPECTARERRLLQQRRDGYDQNLYLCDSGPVVDQFREAREAYEEFASIADDIGEPQLLRTVSTARRGVAGLSRSLSAVNLSDKYRAGHPKAVSHRGRINQLERTVQQLSGDAAAGRKPLMEMRYEVEQLVEVLEENPDSTWKRGAVRRAMQKVYEREESLIIVAPDSPAKSALEADLRLNHERFYTEVKQHVDFCTPDELPQTLSADHLLLYGPPKYSDRWLLRAPHGDEVGVLCYPHELGLLRSQKQKINNAVADLLPGSDTVGAIGDSVELTIDADTAEYTPVTVSISGESTDDPGTGSDSDRLDTYGGAGSGETGDSGIKSILENDLGDSDSFTPPEFGTARSESSPDGAKESSHVECVDIHVREGKAISKKPTQTIDVASSVTGEVVEKPANEVVEGDHVVAVHDRDKIRDEVERLLLTSGYIDKVGHARKWKHQLQAKIDHHDDSLDEFKNKLENYGLDKRRSTYDDWYHNRITLPKAKKSLYAIADVYDMEKVLDDFDKVWEANYDIRRIKTRLIKELKDRELDRLSGRASDSTDVVLDDDLNIRLSDFDATQEDGTPYVQVHTVVAVKQGITVPPSNIGRWRDL